MDRDLLFLLLFLSAGLMKGMSQLLFVGLGMARSSFINPSSSTNFHVYRVLNLMKNNVQCCRHSNKFAPSSNLFDLKQSAAILGLKLLTRKTLSRKPTLG